MPEPSSLLIVRLGALGDVVHAMPVVAAVHAAWPDCRIGWLVQERYAGLVACVRGVARVHPLRHALDVETLRAVRAARYDVCLDLQGLLKSAAHARSSGARRVVGFSRDLLREPLAALAYGETGGVPGGHVIDKNLSLLRRLGLDAARRPVALTIPSSPVVAAARELLTRTGDTHVLEAAEARDFALLNPGAGWPNKRWPSEAFGRLAARLHERMGLRSLVLWGPGEESLAAAVSRASNGAAVMAPLSDIADVLALAQAATVMIAGDTGPLHLAAAVGTPLVGLYGPTPPDRNGPWDPHDRAVSRHDECRCVFKRTCTAATWCLGAVAVEEVVDAVAARLDVASSRAPT